MPANIAFAGENTYKKYFRGSLRFTSVEVSKLTRPRSPETATENAYRTFNGSRLESTTLSISRHYCELGRIPEPGHRLIEHRKDGASRVACLQLGCKRM